MFEVFCAECKIYACANRCSACILSTQNVTKHRDQSPSLTGINWVSDRVSIDFTEYMHLKDVRFFGSLKRTIIIDF